MKHIGYTNSKTWGSDFPSGPVKLFIPEPGMRENVSADNYEHIGWIIPDNARQPLGGKIYETHEHAGPDSRPAYVFRVAAAAPQEPRCPDCGVQVDEHWDCCKTRAATAQPVTRTVTGLEPPLTPVTREEFEALTMRVDTISHMLKPPAPTVAADQPMTFYDYAFIHAAVNHADYYSGSTMTSDVIDDAHEVAGVLTRNRANRP